MKIRTLNPVKHDGVDLEIGAELTVSDEAGAALVAVGAAEEVVKAGKAAKAEPVAAAE